ncbi:MAG: zinc metallopeptidase [Bacilli bacterium]|jgi:Zn-dependent membrane protease YugP|nr:zinc metallopeptidase [Bacilli bacterium]
MDYFTLHSILYGGSIQWILILIPIILVLLAQSALKRTYAKYSKIYNARNLTGLQAARTILDNQGLHNVQIFQGHGQLSDYYNPDKNIIMLSPDVYSGTSVAALAIAAHEVGHAIQHATKYPVIALRNKLLPVSIVAGNLAWIVIMLGLVFASFSGLLWVGIGMLGIIAVFQVVTLPLEFNASSRALSILESTNLLTYEEVPMAKKVLNYAALTYVVALITTLAQVLRLVLIAVARRD